MPGKYTKPTLRSLDENGKGGDGQITPEGVIVVVLVLAGVYTVVGAVTIVAADAA